MVQVKDLLTQSLNGQPMDLEKILQPALFVPEGMSALELLERFKESRSHTALVIDEYGGIQGLVTINDIMESIVGDISLTDQQATPEVTQRPDGSWLIDGKVPIDEFKELVNIENLPDEERYQTVGGLVMTCLGRIPVAGDSFEVSGLRLEVVDMDERRVDKVLVIPASK
jgi:putative hemolysin